MYRTILSVALLACLIALGCSSEVPRSTVYGTIKYQGKAVTETTLIFLAKDNMTYRAELDKEGKYTIEGVPQGPIQVSIQQAFPRVLRKADPDNRKKAGDARESKDSELPPPSAVIMPSFQLPQIYTDPDKSGLGFELKEPKQEWSTDLK